MDSVIAWLLLGLRIESSWLALSGPFFSSFAQIRKLSSGRVWPSFLVVKCFSQFAWATIGPRAMTIEVSLKVGVA